MSDYTKYQHVEKLGSDEVEGILCGEVYVFPKLDGTNAHAWFDGEQMRYGSRKRELSLDSDNAGFMAAMQDNEGLTALCTAHPGRHVWGEWLVPHSLKTYREDAWRKFYVFDVTTEDGSYVEYERLAHLCTFYSVDYIQALRVIENPTEENATQCLQENTFLIDDGKGIGEGVVLKNYQFRNKFGRVCWAKIVTNEFKEKHKKQDGAPKTKGSKQVEAEIVGYYVTKALVDKEFAKIQSEDGWNSRMIPRLLNTVFHCLVTEHTWDACKKYKNADRRLPGAE